MKEIKITCPKCNEETIYKRDNTFYYLSLFGIIIVSIAIGFVIGL